MSEETWSEETDKPTYEKLPLHQRVVLTKISERRYLVCKLSSQGRKNSYMYSDERKIRGMFRSLEYRPITKSLSYNDAATVQMWILAYICDKVVFSDIPDKVCKMITDYNAINEKL